MIRTKPVFLVLVMILLANCTTQLPAVTYTTTPQATDTSTPDIKPSETATWTPRPTNAPTFTPSLTWTPMPTLSAQQAQAKIKELLETNGGCELPCWWGLIPNHTSWPEALQFLTPMTVDIGQGERVNFQKDGKSHFSTSFDVYYELAGASEPARILIGVQDNIISGINVFPSSTQYKYQLYQILSLFGMPKQIFISAQQSAPNPILPPTVIILDYSDIGVWASYGYIPSEVGENLVVCPEPGGERVSVYDNVGGRLRLFDPDMENDRGFSIEEYADMVGGFTAKKLEDVTNMTIETFYNTFIDPEPETCLETPADLWP